MFRTLVSGTGLAAVTYAAFTYAYKPFKDELESKQSNQNYAVMKLLKESMDNYSKVLDTIKNGAKLENYEELKSHCEEEYASNFLKILTMDFPKMKKVDGIERNYAALRIRLDVIRQMESTDTDFKNRVYEIMKAEGLLCDLNTFIDRDLKNLALIKVETPSIDSSSNPSTFQNFIFQRLDGAMYIEEHYPESYQKFNDEYNLEGILLSDSLVLGEKLIEAEMSDLEHHDAV